MKRVFATLVFAAAVQPLVLPAVVSVRDTGHSLQPVSSHIPLVLLRGGQQNVHSNQLSQQGQQLTAENLTRAALYSETELNSNLDYISNSIIQMRNAVNSVRNSIIAWTPSIQKLAAVSSTDVGMSQQDTAALAGLAIRVSPVTTNHVLGLLTPRVLAVNSSATAVAVQLAGGNIADADEAVDADIEERILETNRTLQANGTELSDRVKSVIHIEGELRDNASSYAERVLRREVDRVLSDQAAQAGAELTAAAVGLGPKNSGLGDPTPA